MNQDPQDRPPIDYKQLGVVNPQPGPSRAQLHLQNSIHSPVRQAGAPLPVPGQAPREYGSGGTPAIGSKGSASKSPSEKSVNWLRDILTRRELPAKGPLTGAQRALAGLTLLDQGGMSQAMVSKCIDEFKDCPLKGASPEPRVAAPRAVRDKALEFVDALAAHAAEDDEQADLQRVVAYLKGRREAGTINEFGLSLLEQFEARGSLSPRQVEVALRGMPSVATEAPKGVSPLPFVPEGRYAVDNAAGELTFYRVKRGDSRTWIHLKAGPSEHEVPFTHAGYTTILQSIIDAGPLEAAKRYARELGRCSVCHLELTNRLSRELSIGPKCGGRYYEDASEWAAVKADARSALRARGLDPDERVEA